MTFGGRGCRIVQEILQGKEAPGVLRDVTGVAVEFKVVSGAFQGLLGTDLELHESL